MSLVPTFKTIEEREAWCAAEQAGQAAIAKTRMQIFDGLPKRFRNLVNEYGNLPGIAEAHLMKAKADDVERQLCRQLGPPIGRRY
jgi:hypothetical protein